MVSCSGFLKMTCNSRQIFATQARKSFLGRCSLSTNRLLAALAHFWILSLYQIGGPLITLGYSERFSSRPLPKIVFGLCYGQAVGNCKYCAIHIQHLVQAFVDKTKGSDLLDTGTMWILEFTSIYILVNFRSCEFWQIITH